ncbi:MAG: helix-turn-helix domain-containing protein [Phascolarctobacterium sp.]|nr:helix-turn-helix domain-containing protein [Phascolarctobacterium sp.]
MITDAKTFGEVIHQKRKELNDTQTFLSEVTGISVSFLSDLENGKKTCEREKVIYIANMLGLEQIKNLAEH